MNIFAITDMQKGTSVPVHAMKAYKGSRGMALLILNLMLDAEEWSISCPGHICTSENNLVTHLK